jgi:hypothetical protein
MINERKISVKLNAKDLVKNQENRCQEKKIICQIEP